jgi:hypothetical protein
MVQWWSVHSGIFDISRSVVNIYDLEDLKCEPKELLWYIPFFQLLSSIFRIKPFQ